MFFQQFVTREQLKTTSLKINANSVHLWLVEISSLDSSIFDDFFSTEEIRKAEAFFFSKDRQTFLVCRGLLRFLTGKYLNIDASRIEFRYNRYGKPEIADRTFGDFFFNLSHSGDFGLLAFRQNFPIGVDLESIKKIDYQTLSRNVFSTIEQIEFNSVPDNLKSIAFFRGWTRKEAFIKAIGKGLSFPLQDFSVSLRPEKKTSEVVFNFENTTLPGEWEIIDVSCPEGYCGALAISHPSEVLIESFQIVHNF